MVRPHATELMKRLPIGYMHTRMTHDDATTYLFDIDIDIDIDIGIGIDIDVDVILI